MKISDLEKSWFADTTAAQSPKSQHNLMIMRRYIDNKKKDAINKATDALIFNAIKNGIVFNRLNEMPITKENLASKKIVYQDYKKFIKEINKLPLIEREYIKVKLNENLTECRKKYYFYLIISDYENALKAKTFAKSIKTTIKSINGKNRTLEIVK